jgi:hypothetical protein
MGIDEQHRVTTSTRWADRTGRITDGGRPDRILVPVLAGTGGAGRSTMAALLAQQLAIRGGSAVVLDAGHPNTSPWRTWLTAPATAVPPGEPARLRVPDGVTVRVLTDTRPRPTLRPPARLDVATWAGHPGLAGHRCRVVDTDTPLLAALATGPDPTSAIGWLCQAGSTPVLCLPASPRGVADAQSLVTLLERLGLPAHRVTVAVVAVAAGRVPRRVLAGLTLLEPRVAATVRVPHDRWVRATGGVRIDRTGRPLRRAVALLAGTLTSLAASVVTEPLATDPARSPAGQLGAVRLAPAPEPQTTPSAAAATGTPASPALVRSS